MQVHDLTAEYQAKSDEELLLLAAESEQLEAIAQTHLHNELVRRRLDSSKWTANLFRGDTPLPLDSGDRVVPSAWRHYRRWTGRWPVLSIAAYVANVFVFIFCVALIAVLGGKRDWSEAKFIAAVAVLALLDVAVSGRFRKAIWLKELRDYRRKRN